MRFGFGTRRSRRRHRARPTGPFPAITGWEVSAGRWSYTTGPGWIQHGANVARTYDDGSGSPAYLIEGAETFHSAPWHDSTAPHGTSNDAYLFKSLAGDAIAYAGSHSQPDIHGTSGKGVELTQGNVANGIFTATNLKAAAASTNDIVRSEMLFSIPVTTGVGGTISLRNSQSRAVVLNYDASGNVTGWNAVPASNTYRAGYGEGAPRSDGAKTWFVWMECKATAAANVTPALGLPTAIAGRKVVVHDLRILLNPQTAPKAVPVLAANKTFAADTLLTGRTDTVGALFHRLARCRTRITDGRLAVATTWARSGPYLPYETRVEIVASSEASDAPGILPNEWQDVDFTPWLTPANFSLVLGPGYYNQRVGTGLGTGCVNMTITSAFKADPLLMAQLERVKTSVTYLTGSLTLDDLVLFSRADEYTTFFEQVDILGASSALNHFNMAGSFSAQRCLFVSHPTTHSRARGEAQDDASDNYRVYVGGNAHVTTGGAGVTCNVSGSHFWRMGRSMMFGAASQAGAVTVTADDCFHDQIWSDCWYWSQGTITATFHRNLFGRCTAASSDLYQSRKQIEVDTGSGWQSLTAAGLTVASLPVGRRASFAGTWNFTTSTFTAAPDPARTCMVRDWNRRSSTAYDKPGYQWHSSQADRGDYETYHAAGDVYEIQQAGGPSPAKPWVRVTHDLGNYTGASTYVTSANPATYATGTHADTCQINRTGVNMNSLTANDVVVLGNANGPFLTGMTTMLATDSAVVSAAFQRMLVITPQTWGLAFDWSRTAGSTCTLTDFVVLPMTSRARFTSGVTATQSIGAAGLNQTITLSNVHVGYKTGVSAVAGASGGTITGSHTRVDSASILFGAVTPPTGTPKLPDWFLPDWCDPVTGNLRDDIDPLDSAFGFTAQAEADTGIALNALLATVRGTHARWSPLKARIARLHRAPNHVLTVSASVAVGSVVLGGLTASGWAPLWSGNEKRYFTIENGDLKVARPLTGINQCWLLQTDNDRTILVDIQ